METVTAIAQAPDSPVKLRQDAIQTLGTIGKPALPEVMKILEGRDITLRAAALQALRTMGPQAADAVPFLSKWVESGD